MGDKELSSYAKDVLTVALCQLDAAADDLRRLRDGSPARQPVTLSTDDPMAAAVTSSHIPLPRSGERMGAPGRAPGEGVAGERASHPHLASPSNEGEEHEGHIIDGEFQSDKYPTCPAGKVPLSTRDPMAQDLLWQYAQRRRAVDSQFADDLERALRLKGYYPNQTTRAAALHSRDMLALARLLEAVTPTVDTMNVYSGKFTFQAKFQDEVSDNRVTLDVEVPAETIVEIMAAIRKKAGIDG